MIDKNNLEFDKNKFANILKQIGKQYNNQTLFSIKSGVSRTYLSQYINCKLDAPPNRGILKKLASASNGIVTYEELLEICGYKQLEEQYLKLFTGDIDFLFQNGESNEEKIKKTEELIKTIDSNKQSLEKQLDNISKDPTMKLLYIDSTLWIKTSISLEKKKLQGLNIALQKFKKTT